MVPSRTGEPCRPSIRRLLLPLTLIALAVLLTAPAAAAADAPDSLGLAASYDVAASIRWDANKMSVTSTATVTNTSSDSVDALTFEFAPALIGHMNLREVQVDDEGTTAHIDDANVIVDLPQALDPGAQATVLIGYDATFNTTGKKKRWQFSKKDNVVTAYRWIPWLSKRHTWATPNFGEPYVTQVASDVTVTLTSDRAGVRYATSGQQTAVDGASQTFVAHNVRDFNFSASTRYRLASTDLNGVTLNVYTLSLSSSSLASLTQTAYNAFSDKVGAYPYPTLTVAEIPLSRGMESPGMIWIPSNATSLTRRRYLVTHEVAHQWFYGVVGNDQATDPFADEALAEFLARTITGFRASKCRETNLDGSVYDYSSACYYEVIYVQGADYLDEYFDRVGSDAFWAGLRDYYQQYQFGLGGTLELLQALDGEAGANGGGHQDRFPSLYPNG